MAWGARQYADVLDALHEHGLPAKFTETGGMCAALEAQLENSHTMLITDADDYLSWARAEHNGWAVRLNEAAERDDGPVAFGQVDSSDATALIGLVRDAAATAPDFGSVSGARRGSLSRTHLHGGSEPLDDSCF